MNTLNPAMGTALEALLVAIEALDRVSDDARFSGVPHIPHHAKTLSVIRTSLALVEANVMDASRKGLV